VGNLHRQANKVSGIASRDNSASDPIGRFEQSSEDSHASASISIVIPIHDSPIVTRRCLASLESYASESEVILVDDSSELGETLEVIREFGGRNKWKVIRNEKALGHSGASDAGASLATRPYLCFLNSDTVVTPWCWTPVKNAFEADPSIGAAGPSTSESGNAQTIDVAASQRGLWSDNQICSFAEGLLNRSGEPAVKDLEWLSGFALFIKRSLWEDIGGFDRNLPDYGNDVDLSRQVTSRGYRIVWIKDSYIHHFGRQSYQVSLGDGGIHERVLAAKTYTKQKQRSQAEDKLRKWRSLPSAERQQSRREIEKELAPVYYEWFVEKLKKLEIVEAFEKCGEIRSMGQSYFTISLSLLSRATRKLTRAFGFGGTRAEG
jgi:GT2 family glycosyltransferase